jgi:hypothetical protein
MHQTGTYVDDCVGGGEAIYYLVHEILITIGVSMYAVHACPACGTHVSFVPCAEDSSILNLPYVALHCTTHDC